MEKIYIYQNNLISIWKKKILKKKPQKFKFKKIKFKKESDKT